MSIQILRAVAAFGVLTHHTAHEVASHTGRSIPFNDLVVGAAGVDLFFVISGFVMVYASEPLFGRAGAPRVFFLRRLARVAPLYWATTAILLVYVYAMYRLFPPPYISAPGVLASFLFLPYPLPNGLMGPVHALGWTLNYEMFFYAVFAAAILLPRRGAVFAIVALFAALVAIGRLVALPQPFAFWCDPLILEFCFGMLVALAYREGVRLPRAICAALLLAALAGYGATAVFGLSLPWRALAWGLPGAALVAALALARDAAPAGLAARAFGYLGDVSYSLYLVHVLVFPIVRRLLVPWLDHPLMPWVYAFALVAASIVAAILSYRAFERPITRALQKRIGGARLERLNFGGTRAVEG